MNYLLKHNISINIPDLMLLQSFLSKEIVCYFAQKINVKTHADLIFLSHSAVVDVIVKVHQSAIKMHLRFVDLSFRQKAHLVDDVLENCDLHLGYR